MTKLKSKVPAVAHGCPNLGQVNVSRGAGCIFTSWAQDPHFQWGQAGLAAVHCERLQDASSDTGAQSGAGNLDLARIHDIFHWNSEGTAWKTSHRILSTGALPSVHPESHCCSAWALCGLDLSQCPPPCCVCTHVHPLHADTVPGAGPRVANGP